MAERLQPFIRQEVETKKGRRCKIGTRNTRKKAMRSHTVHVVCVCNGYGALPGEHDIEQQVPGFNGEDALVTKLGTGDRRLVECPFSE